MDKLVQMEFGEIKRKNVRKPAIKVPLKKYQ